jgi:biopolymer transport protein ExbB/TolQ
VIASVNLTGRALSGVATALKIPVQVVAILLLAVLAYELGRIATESWRRVRPGAAPLERVATSAMSDPAEAARIARSAPGPLSELAVRQLAAADGPDGYETALADYELRIQRRLDRTRILVRAGPAVGLMGTLIPLAPGLGALGQGNYSELASDLRLAFSATVIGLLVGTVAFALTLIRTRVYTEDLAGLERAVAARGATHHRLATVGDHSA